MIKFFNSRSKIIITVCIILLIIFIFAIWLYFSNRNLPIESISKTNPNQVVDINVIQDTNSSAVIENVVENSIDNETIEEETTEIKNEEIENNAIKNNTEKNVTKNTMKDNNVPSNKDENSMPNDNNVTTNTSTNTEKDNITNKDTEDKKENEKNENNKNENKELANTYFSKYNAEKTQQAVNYINSKMQEDEMYSELGGYATPVKQKPTDFWFSYSSNNKLNGLALAGCVVKVYVEDYYRYNSTGTSYYLYDTKVYAYQEVL